MGEYVHVHVSTQTLVSSSFFLGKVTALGVLCCFALFVCLTLLASFFLPSHLKHVHVHVYTCKWREQWSILLQEIHVHVHVLVIISVDGDSAMHVVIKTRAQNID